MSIQFATFRNEDHEDADRVFITGPDGTRWRVDSYDGRLRITLEERSDGRLSGSIGIVPCTSNQVMIAPVD